MSQRVFISYCWTTPTHEDWVINLAERLMSDGIEVVIDKWDLKEGHDIYNFMESMVKSPTINKVLIVLDKKYSEKADSRSGGVGTETQIISPKVYNDVAQEKFIPVVAERDNAGNAYIPTYLNGRMYIDLSSNEQFEKNYESLIRNIYNRPLHSKPKIGTPPSYLFEETPMNFKTSMMLRSFDSIMDRHPNRLEAVIRDFLDEFYANLKDFNIKFETRNHVEIGKAICDNINQYTPLRNDFIAFFDKVTKLNVNFDFEILIKFLEKLPLLHAPDESKGSWSEYEFDNFKFITHELFLYLVVVGLKNENYAFVEDTLYSSYFTKDRYNYKKEAQSFEVFSKQVDTIDAYYQQTHSKNFYSPMAHLIVTRIPENMSTSMLVQADLLCHYVATISGGEWFPITYIYDTSGKFELFYKMVSQRHFNKVKRLFGVTTADELKKKLKKVEEEERETGFGRLRYPRCSNSVAPLYSVIDIESVATKR